MSDASVDPSRSGKRRWLIGGSIAVAVILIAGIGIALAAAQGGAPASDAAPSPTASRSAATAAPGTPSATPAPEPTATESAGTSTMPELEPVAPDEPSDNDAGLLAEIVAMEAVEGEPVQAGDIGGPSVRFTIRIANDTDAPFDLATVAVNGYIGEDRRPAVSLIKPGGSPFSGMIAPGADATGVYIYNIPVSERDDVTITVDYLAGQPAFVFHGAVG